MLDLHLIQEVFLESPYFFNRDRTQQAMYSKVENEVTRLAEGLTINLGGLSAVNSRAIEGFPIGDGEADGEDLRHHARPGVRRERRAERGATRIVEKADVLEEIVVRLRARAGV